MIDERWADIPGHPGYQASSLGQVRSITTDPPELLRPFRHKAYLYVRLLNPTTGRTAIERVHRFVLLAFRGPPPAAGLVCRHLDGDPLNNRASNLAWGTRSENHRDAVRHGTANCLRRGGRHPSAKLTDDEFTELVRLAREGADRLSIARRFGVSQNYVYMAMTGRGRMTRIPESSPPSVAREDSADHNALAV